MIDVENMVFTEIYNLVTTNYPGTEVKSVLNLDPSVFPCVCVEEITNTVHTQSIDSGSNEKYANVTYEINVFTAEVTNKKQLAKDIINLIDDRLGVLGFVRTHKEPISLSDGTKYRIVTRYTATISTTDTIYRR